MKFFPDLMRSVQKDVKIALLPTDHDQMQEIDKKYIIIYSSMLDHGQLGKLRLLLLFGLKSLG